MITRGQGFQNYPTATNQATVSAPATVGVKWMCVSVTVQLSSVATAQAIPVRFQLRDGGTGAGTILWQVTLGALAANANDKFTWVAPDGAGDNFNDPFGYTGSSGNAMTLETLSADTISATCLAGVSMLVIPVPVN